MAQPPDLKADELRAHELALLVRSDLARQAELMRGNRHERRKQAAIQRRKSR